MGGAFKVGIGAIIGAVLATMIVVLAFPRYDLRVTGGSASAYMIDRWTGDVRYCYIGSCRPIEAAQELGTLRKPNVFDQFDGDKQAFLQPANSLDFYPRLARVLSVAQWIGYLLAAFCMYAGATWWAARRDGAALKVRTYVMGFCAMTFLSVLFALGKAGLASIG